MTEQKIYKIKEIGARNFGAFQSFQSSLDPNVTYFCGNNGAGKTTAGVNAVWAAMVGIAKRGDTLCGDKFRFIGKYAQSAVTTLTLEEISSGVTIKIERRILKGNTVLKATDSNGNKITSEYLKSIFSSLFINLSSFSQMSSVEQAKAIGIDTSDFDKKKAAFGKTRLEIGRVVKRLKGAVESMGEPDAVDAVDIDAIRNHLHQAYATNARVVKDIEAKHSIAVREVMDFNNEQRKIGYEYQMLVGKCKDTHDMLVSLTAQLKEVEAELIVLQSKRSVAEQPLPEKPIPEKPQMNQIDTSKIEANIKQAIRRNEAAAIYEKYRTEVNALQQAETDYAGMTRRLKENEIARLEYIQSATLPFANITINDKGGLEIDGRPFSPAYFSHGQIIKYTAMIIAANPPPLRYCYISDASLIDEDSLPELLAYLNKHDFQVVCEVVSKEKRSPTDNSILLRDMEILDADSYKEYDKANKVAAETLK